MNKCIIAIFISFIRVYQRLLSPLKRIFFRNENIYCRFFPSCSEYACESLRQYGLLKGTVASVRRIIRCNPWNKGGYDPV